MSIISPTHADRLTDVRRRTHELRERRAEVQKLHAAAKEAASAYRGDDLQASEEFQRLQRYAGDLDDVRNALSLVEAEENYILSVRAGMAGPVLRDNFLQDPVKVEELFLRMRSEERMGDVMLGVVRGRDEFVADLNERQKMFAAAGDVVLPSDASRTSAYGILPPLLRPLRIADLVPTTSMTGGAFEILVEQYTGGAAETAELALKPSGTLVLTDQTVVARTIAVWTRIARQTWTDVDGLAESINQLLEWDVRNRLDGQILNGNGTGQNLLGILATSGIGNTASAAGDVTNADVVASAIRDVSLANAQAQAIVMHPNDVAKAVKGKASGTGEYYSGGPFSAAPTSMWGLPLIASPAIPSGTGLVGDFSRGAQLWVREGVTARISDSDQDDFLRNALKILLETRVAFATLRPACFSKVALSFGA